MEKMRTRVENMTSNNTGRAVPNQFIIHTEDGKRFQSYDSIIAFRPFGDGARIQLDAHYWDYSMTTGKYRNRFLRETKKETEKKIASGVYELTDLN